jgi:hypothetical protein
MNDAMGALSYLDGKLSDAVSAIAKSPTTETIQLSARVLMSLRSMLDKFPVDLRPDVMEISHLKVTSESEVRDAAEHIKKVQALVRVRRELEEQTLAQRK